jgi:hypothetical protein
MVRGPSSSQQGAPEYTSTLDFINWLTICTPKGGIFWEKQPELISTTLKGEMPVMFELSKTTPGALVWRLVIIRSPEGELLRHTRLTASMEGTSLVSAIDALFLAVTTPAPHT